MAEQSINGDAPLSPHLVVPSLETALRFYTEAFGAVEEYVVTGPAGDGLEAAAWVNGGLLLLSAGPPGEGEAGAASRPYYACLHITLVNVEQAFYRAVEAGATPLRHPGEGAPGRQGMLRDPFGYDWCLRAPVTVVAAGG